MLQPLGGGNIFVLNYGRKYSFILVNCQGVFWRFPVSAKKRPDAGEAFVENVQEHFRRVRRFSPTKNEGGGIRLSPTKCGKISLF